MLQSSFIFMLTDNSKKSITYSFRTKVKIAFPENVILKYWKTIYYKINLVWILHADLKGFRQMNADFIFYNPRIK